MNTTVAKSIKLNWYKVGRSLNLWTPYLFIIVFLIATPILVIFIKIFQGPGETMQHLAGTVLTDYITNTIILIVFVGLLSMVFGISTAWLVSTCEFPGRKIFDWALILPLAIPSYIAAYTYAGIFDYTGPVQTFIRNYTSFNPGFIDIMNIYGICILLALVLYPYVFVVARSSFLRQSRTLLETARNLGSSSWQTFFRIALPVSRPAIVGGVTLVLMETLNDYGAVKYFGVSTFTTGIFRAWFSLNDSNAAVYLAALLMGFIFLLILMERYQRGQKRFDENNPSSKPIQKRKLKGYHAFFAFITCLFPLLLGFIIPVTQLLSWALQTAGEVVDAEFWTMVFNSFSLAFLAALICIITATILIYSVKLNDNLPSRSIAKFAVLGYSVPGAVIAVGIMIPVIALDKKIAAFINDLFNAEVGFLLYGTIFTLVFAYTVRFLAVAYNPIYSGFTRVCQNLDEAARSLGNPPLRTLLKIDLPLIKGTIFSGALLVFVDVLKELPLTLILRPFDFNTLAIKAFELASDEMVAQSSSAALIIIATGIFPIIILSKLISGRES